MVRSILNGIFAAAGWLVGAVMGFATAMTIGALLFVDGLLHREKKDEPPRSD